MPACPDCNIRINNKNRDEHPGQARCLARQEHQKALAEGLVPCGALSRLINRDDMVIRQAHVWRKIDYTAPIGERRWIYSVLGRYYCMMQVYAAAKEVQDRVAEAKRIARAAREQALSKGLVRVFQYFRKYLPKGSVVKLPTYVSTYGKYKGFVRNQLWVPVALAAAAARAYQVANALEGFGRRRGSVL